MLSFRRALVLQLLLPAQRFRKDVLIVARALRERREREKERYRYIKPYSIFIYIYTIYILVYSTYHIEINWGVIEISFGLNIQYAIEQEDGEQGQHNGQHDAQIEHM